MISRACSRGLVLFLEISAAMSTKSAGLAEMSFLARAMVLSLAFGAALIVLVVLRMKIWERERIVGSRRAGCSVVSTKWQ